MITRKENLLIRPWQQRRYDNHRRKVQSAAPAIDNKPPECRQHVALKLKKKQKEKERCQEIEKNNFNLLKRLSYVMRTNRVDNYWETPQPNFLNRVSIYNVIEPKFEDLCIEEPLRKDKIEGFSGRKLKCIACTPQSPQEIKIPEERVPWEPEKPSVSRLRSQSVPPMRKPTEKLKVPRSAPCQKIETKPKKQNGKPKANKTVFVQEPQSITLSRGCLKLSVNFPSDTLVKMQSGNRERILMHNVCNCKKTTLTV